MIAKIPPMGWNIWDYCDFFAYSFFLELYVLY